VNAPKQVTPNDEVEREAFGDNEKEEEILQRITLRSTADRQQAMATTQRHADPKGPAKNRTKRATVHVQSCSLFAAAPIAFIIPCGLSVFVALKK
jgi:hypothetical protein